ncbi:M81 family metallopeptidase [Cupriavidus basilensis]
MTLLLPARCGPPGCAARSAAGGCPKAWWPARAQPAPPPAMPTKPCATNCWPTCARRCRWTSVLLGLHGAMVADGYDDREGDLLQRVRAIVGPGTVIGAELDPHSHLTPEMVSARRPADRLQGIPAHRRCWSARWNWSTCARPRWKGKVRPVASVVDCEMIVTVHYLARARARLRGPHPVAGRPGRRAVGLHSARLLLG